jgi:hypothetical protein
MDAAGDGYAALGSECHQADFSFMLMAGEGKG